MTEALKIVKIIDSCYIFYTNHFDRPSIKAAICKMNNLLVLSVSALNTIVHKKVVPKIVVEKFSLSALKIEKVTFSPPSPT